MERFTLTTDQEQVLNIALKGHNLLITGQGGTGKSTLVRAIYSGLKKNGKKVEVVCASGIATTVYDRTEIRPSTAHAFYGLRTADLPCNLVVDRAVANNLVAERVKGVDVVIWDEISMSSRRVFELANSIHLELASECDSSLLFGGTQVILVGDFLQLRPVANYFDLGKFVFTSPLFIKAISHRVELTTIMRQNEEDKVFMACLKEIRVGECGPESREFLGNLTRDLPEESASSAIHVFFKRLPVQMFNLRTLFSLPGDLTRFDAIDEGDVVGIQCPADQVLLLKPGSAVMLLWNKTDTLRNGSRGKFVCARGDGVLINFDGEGQVFVRRETWNKTSRNGEAVGKRSQIPLVLMWAITCHKSQGQTFDSAVVHCSKEFVSGLLYVALSRVRASSCLKVVNFKKSQLLPPPAECINVCEHTNEIEVDLACCRSKVLSPADLKLKDDFELPNDEDEGHDVFEETVSTDNLVQSYFERGEPDEIAIDLQTVHMLLTDEVTDSFCKCPPPMFSIVAILERAIVPEPLSDFATNKNKLLEELVKYDAGKLDIMGNILWSHACKIILEDTLQNVNEVQLSTTQWSKDTRELYMLITRSSSYISVLEMFFEAKPLNVLQSTVGASLMLEVYKEAAKYAAERIAQATAREPLEFNVRSMPAEGLAKVRHIGAWAIRKIINEQHRYVRANMVSSNAATRDEAFKRHEIASLLEDNIIANFETLSLTSMYPETLNVTEDLQFRNRGLSHIEDCAYRFFIEVEALRVECLNGNKLALFGEEIVSKMVSTMKSDAQLKTKWVECFPQEEIRPKMGLINQAFDAVIDRYTMVGAGQYLRDYRRAHRLKKSAEHRKTVLLRKKALEEKKAAVPFADIVADKSPAKVTSHVRLQQYVVQFGEKAVSKVFMKSQLQSLCRAYGLQVNARSAKAKLVQDLVPVIKMANDMPHPYHTDVLHCRVNLDETNQRVTLRISRNQ